MRDRMRILITGGCGFIGTHAVQRWTDHHKVLALDNLSRPGSKCNLEWLSGQFPMTFRQGDVRNAEEVAATVRTFHPDVVLHLAAQVAVTTSIADPAFDFAVNAQGTFNVLEAVRRHAPEAVVLYASTNKVYGGMEQVGVVLRDGRYAYTELPEGVNENQLLDFHSPYGCSKGTGDQYVRDYARVYGLRTVVFRQSCIYGTRQFGMEDQGWVAWFAIRAVQGRPVTIFGDGRQVRDVLWVGDLLDAYELAISGIEEVRGRVYNLGGGPDFTLSLLDLLELLKERGGGPVEHNFGDWRQGDQKVFVSDIRRAKEELGWQPRVAPAEGIARLYKWVVQNRELLDTAAPPATEGPISRPRLRRDGEHILVAPPKATFGRTAAR